MSDSASAVAIACAHEHDASFFGFIGTFVADDNSLIHQFECHWCGAIEEHIESADQNDPHSPADVIRQTRKLLTAPSAWADSSYATDSAGREVDPTADSATSWCFVGGLRRTLARVSNPEHRSRTAALVYSALCESARRYFGLEYDRLRQDHPDESPELFVAILNDTNGRRHEQILEWCDRTVAALTSSTSPQPVR